MRKLKLLMAACALVGSVVATWAQTDVTNTYITNAGFDACTAETSDVDAKTKKDYSSNGWTTAASGSYTTIAVTAYGGGKKVGGSTTPSTKKDGTTVSGNTLGIIAGWADDVKIQSREITLPAGVYTLTVDHYLTSATTNYTTTRFGFVTSSNSYLASTTFTASTWTTETVTFTLTESTTGNIQLGLKGDNNTGSGAPAVFYDDVTLIWTDPELAASQVTLGGYIKRATALNAVLADTDLETAITTAQGVLDSSTLSSECDDASEDLSSAIETALSSATPVALTNANFDTTPNNTLSGSETIFGGTLSTSTSNPDNTKDLPTNNKGDHGYLYDVSGWVQYSKFNSTASQGTTSEYGTAMPANGWSTNSTTPPTSDMFGASDGAALHLSAGWNDQARYQQTINELPSGRYVFYYEVINQYSNTGIASNYTGVSGVSGDFYGTSNSFVYSSLNSIEQGVWKAQAFEFNVAKTAKINFNVGFTTSTTGSGNGAKLWIDNVLVYRIGDVIVTDGDATAILSEVDALDDAIYNATDKTNLATAKSTFNANRTLDNYNALRTAITAASNSVTVYEALNTAITKVEGWTTDATNVTDPIRTKYNNGTYANSTTADDIYSEYQAAEIAALVAAEATSYTSVIINPSFETNDLTGWSAESRNDTGVKQQSNATYSITSGDAVDGSYLFNSWGGTAENNVYQTITSLPAGTYTLSALVAGFNGEDLVLAANAATTTITVAGDKTVGYTANVVFTLAEAGDVTIKVSNTKSQGSSDASFIKADNFRLVKGDITTTDFTDLNTAISAAEAHTLGFEKDEFAPYNNVAAILALKAAKEVDQTVPMLTSTYTTILSNLTGATWDDNDEELNAVYDGDFAIHEAYESGDADPDMPGWKAASGRFRRVLKTLATYPGLADASAGSAVFTHAGNFQYGNTIGYTMPLKENTVYELDIKIAGWNNEERKNVSISVLNEDDGLPTTNLGTADKDISVGFTSYKKLFRTGAAGNYILSHMPLNNSVFTDVVIKKAVAEEIAISENDTEAPEASEYANVTLTRNFTADVWNTFVVPFDIDNATLTSVFGDDVEVAEATLTSSSVAFNTMATPSITANKPVIIKGVSKSGPYNFSGVIIKNATPTITTDGTSFVGTYTPQTLDDGVYYIASNKLKKATGTQNIKGYRAYFTTSAGTRLTLTLDDEETTAIDGISTAANLMNGEVYNLNGMKMTEGAKLQKGIYVVNGKKVIVK